MIKVLQVGLSNHLGGIETYLRKLYTHIDRDVFQFDFLITGLEEPCFYNEFLDMNSTFHFVTPRGANPLKNRREVDEVLRNNHYDIVHCNLNSLSYSYPVTAALKNNIPTIVHSRNAGIKSSRTSQLLHQINYIRLPKNKITKLAVSTEAGNWMFGHDSDFIVINNGVYADKYKYNPEARSTVRSNNELEVKDKVLINVGALKEQKNHSFLLETVQNLVAKDTKYKLLLVGEGNLHDQLKKQVDELNLRDNVKFLGNVDNVPNVLSAADIFVFPSLYEGFPNAVLEAQTSGLPCVISDTITSEVLVTANSTALPLKKGAHYWAQYIDKIFLDSKRENAYQMIETQRLTVKDEIQKIESLYKELSQG